jgi:pimeloyl-ACP methyl ester carboxylesterase
LDPRPPGTLVFARTVEYTPGRFADVFGDATQRTILLWHGMQSDARAVVRPLAGLLAGHGAAVVAPDWNCHAPDRGRADLLRSIDFTRQHTNDTNGIVLVGWSLGGAAAAALTLGAANLNVALAHTVCLAGAFMVRDSISGRYVAEGVFPKRVGPRFTLLHGLADDVVPVTRIAGAEYNPVADRYEPAKDGPAQHVASEVAARIAAILGR